MSAFQCLILGAAGRDFHDFQVFFRQNPGFRVRAFTATQIPFIDRRVFPRELAGDLYDQDIPVYDQADLPRLIRELEIDFVFLAYSDLPHQQVMHLASQCQALGAAFALLGPRQTQVPASRPVIAVTAVRTGAGKSPLSQFLARHLRQRGLRAGILRHPMPYGDLRRQVVQRLATWEDLDRHECTVEEREEYEPYIEQGLVVFAGVDYQRIVAAAEQESDVILWDGGNNDYPFLQPDLWITVADALRPGHETTYYPGETNLRAAHVVVINKVTQAALGAVDAIRQRARQVNPLAKVIEADLEVEVDQPDLIAGRRVLVVEDGPTLTHGDMTYGAGTIAAERHGAAERIDPRPHAVGSIADTLQRYPRLDRVLPALGYSPLQRDELARTIENCRADLVVDASPARLDRLLHLTSPMVRVRYQFRQLSGPDLLEQVDALLCDEK
ncbi:MAG: tetraacyldisaccharide 4'-kinase [Pirellulaceae bacterium]|nr:tetraacyldisaccharide 4'-kinase [Pirellulaceae bacterium]